MVRAKVLKIVLDGRGSYLGMEKGCFVVMLFLLVLWLLWVFGGLMF